MEQNKREMRRRVFRQELFTLKDEGYLSEAIVETVAKAHHQYHLDLMEQEAISLPKAVDASSQTPAPPKPIKEKKILSPEEIRERNITWSLNIGVIFLLIGGLFVATSNWESMTAYMKSGSIAVVALLFYGIAFLAKKVLHIDKTAFAFIVLGSLFLPIFILSLGWFELLGPYLSVYGEGKYILGALGSILPGAVYLLLAKKLASRLFVWFSYISISLTAAFLLGSLKLTVDFFYLGIMVFNTVLIFMYHKFKNVDAYKLFSSEFVLFVQVNLVLCTMLMLFFYENEVIYGFNLLLTAIIYLSMMYVSGKKEFHFIFSAMVVYGAYQLIEHSFLDYFGELVYALVAFGMVFIPKALDGKFTLDKIFQYTSAVISGFAFIYISLEGILLRSGVPSIVLLLAYSVIAANFVYLSHQSNKRLFPYLSSVFAASAIFELAALVCRPFSSINFTLTLFITGSILFICLGIIRIHRYVSLIRTSSRDMGLAIMLLSVILAFVLLHWWELGSMLLFLVPISYLLLKHETRSFYKEYAVWLLPIVMGLSVISFGEEVNNSSRYYYETYGNAVNCATSAILVLLSGIVWRRYRERKLAYTSLIVSAVLYGISMIYALTGPIDEIWVRPLVLLIGAGIYYHLYKQVGTTWIPFFVSFNVLLAYFSIVKAISENMIVSQTFNSLIASTSSVVLLVIAYLLLKRDPNLANAFTWLGHVLYPIALLFTWVVYHSDAIYSFIAAIIVYSVSAQSAVKEWKIKTFLYGGFSALFFVISTGLDIMPVLEGKLEFPITSALILLFTFLVNIEYQKRTVYYLIPFSLVGIAALLVTYPFTTMIFITIAGYTLGTLFYLHRIKWDVLGIIPLFLLFLATIEYSYLGELSRQDQLFLFACLGIAMIITGQVVYSNLFKHRLKFSEIKIDGYTIVSFLYFGMMYVFVLPNLWSRVLPGILIATAILLQRKRVPKIASVYVVIFGGGYLLQPYYAAVDYLNVHPLWEREVQVLPWIVLVIFIRFMLKGRYLEMTKWIQWGVLIIVSLVLIQDGLASNTIYDAIILGSLSLLSMIAGMFLQIKSYFFTGAGVLLLNVFLQTRPYWGNLPWWIYLLMTGLILITIASFNEWHKQKSQKGETTFITYLKQKVIDKIRQWD